MSADGCSSSAWPTPATRDYKGANSADHLEISTGAKHLDQLPNFVAHLWVSPSVAISTGGQTSRSGDRKDELLLSGQAQALMDRWMTPRAHEVGNYQYSRGDKSKPIPTLTGQATLRSILPDRPISTVGEESSHIRRTLNPLFVEWLMMWPFGWTSLALMPPASIDSDCSAMEWSRFKQRMRSELSRIDLPPPAPPAQLALFG